MTYRYISLFWLIILVLITVISILLGVVWSVIIGLGIFLLFLMNFDSFCDYFSKSKLKVDNFEKGVEEKKSRLATVMWFSIFILAESVMTCNFVSSFITKNLQFVESITQSYKIFYSDYILFLCVILNLWRIISYYLFYSPDSYSSKIMSDIRNFYLSYYRDYEHYSPSLYSSQIMFECFFIGVYCILLDQFWNFLILMNFDFKTVLLFISNSITP